MNLQDLIRTHWPKEQFQKLALNKTLRVQIEDQTDFLNQYYPKVTLRTRAYTILHDITEETLPRCKCGCNRPAAINNTYPEQGFRQYATPDCSRKDKTIPKATKELLSSYQWLYHQRITLQKSIETIAEELSISPIPVNKYLKHHNLDNLLDARSRNSQANRVLRDKQSLQDLYNQGLTCEQIAEQLNSSKATVSKWLNVHNIETRPPNSYPRKVNKVSLEESSLYEYVKSTSSYEVQQSNRSILNGKELDIYIPEKNLAIEYNGLYSHIHRPYETKESLIKGRNYHLNKTLECEKQGIQLLQFYSDEWLNKPEIVKSIIDSKLGLNNTVYARQCDKVILSPYEKNIFLNENHIQGEDKSKVKLGLVYNGELVCLMTFGQSRFNSKYDWELVRFCNRRGLNVVGGFSRLLKWFRSSYEGSVVSYADRRYSRGEVYLRNGFELVRVNGPSYYYVGPGYNERFNRMKFQKKLLGSYDGTEYERAVAMGYRRIYDCGSLCFGLGA